MKIKNYAFWLSQIMKWCRVYAPQWLKSVLIPLIVEQLFKVHRDRAAKRMWGKTLLLIDKVLQNYSVNFKVQVNRVPGELIGEI